MKTIPSTTIETIISCLIICIIFFNTYGCGSSNNDDAIPNDDPPCRNIEGIWNTTEKVFASDCNEGTYLQNKSYIISQDGCDITAVVNENRFDGFITGNTLFWSGSFPDDGGTNSIQISVSFSDENAFAGSASWEWNDGYYMCTGATEINGESASSR